jgi:translation initiation factor 1
MFYDSWRIFIKGFPRFSRQNSVRNVDLQIFYEEVWSLTTDSQFESFIYFTDEVELSIMAEICPTCGLPKDLCACGEIEKEQQRIRIRLETRKFGKPTTIVDGIDEKNTNLAGIAQKLKGFCACGGTAKNGQIMLQGDHRERVRQFLVKLGYPDENIELQ